MIERDENGVRLRGAMLNTHATALLAAGRGFLRQKDAPRRFVVDLAAVEETDASALAVAFAWLRTARSLGIDLRFAHLPAGMVSQARLYGVDDMLPLG
ncbi:STAS domain-containing protein [Dentiradicibacter hellwigii]|uniref:STAS domain-containing protein n=1 Tax=Dentiradicibacter hellwigii TaxID=3149053 RepID=A0ABV4UDB0_9RHOO